MKLLEINPRFVEDHIQELIKLEDWVPISFANYNAQEDRVEFLKSKNLLITLYEMDELISQKCNYSENPVESYNSVLIEWLEYHPEFESMLTPESLVNFYDLKNNSDRFDFIDLLYDVQLPSEKKVWIPPKEDNSLRDDSTIQLPNLKEKDKIHEKYGLTLLSCYLSYLV